MTTPPHSATDDFFGALEQRIEAATVTGDTRFLDAVYADDFRFVHSTGDVDTKSSWLAPLTAGVRPYVARDVDGVEAEIHADVAVVTGRTRVRRRSDPADVRYTLRYLRVYVLREGSWRLVAQRTLELTRQ